MNEYRKVMSFEDLALRGIEKAPPSESKGVMNEYEQTEKKHRSIVPIGSLMRSRDLWGSFSFRPLRPPLN